MATKKLRQIDTGTYQYTEHKFKKNVFQVTIKLYGTEWFLIIRLFGIINMEFNITEIFKPKNNDTN